MSSFDRMSHFKSIFNNFLHRPNFLKKHTPKIDVYGPDRGKITIYGSNFQQVNLTPNGGVSSTDKQNNPKLIFFFVVVVVFN